MNNLSEIKTQLEMNIAISFLITEKLGIDKKVILEKSKELDKIITNEALKINSGKHNINTINIDTTIVMIILLHRFHMIDKIYDEIANSVGINREVFDHENRNELRNVILEMMKEGKN